MKIRLQDRWPEDVSVVARAALDLEVIPRVVRISLGVLHLVIFLYKCEYMIGASSFGAPRN